MRMFPHCDLVLDQRIGKLRRIRLSSDKNMGVDGKKPASLMPRGAVGDVIISMFEPRGKWNCCAQVFFSRTAPDSRKMQSGDSSAKPSIAFRPNRFRALHGRPRSPF